MKKLNFRINYILEVLVQKPHLAGVYFATKQRSPKIPEFGISVLILGQKKG